MHQLCYSSLVQIYSCLIDLYRLYGWICVELTEYLKGDIQQLLLPATVSEIDDGVENIFSNLLDK